LLDPAVTSVRMVLTPERVVLAEARRTHMLLALFGYAVDAVLINRLVTSESDDPLVAGWRRRQRAVVGDMAQTFGAVPQLVAPLRAAEPVGCAALADLAEQLYGARDPAAVLYDGPRLHLVSDDRGHALRIPLPQGNAGDVELFQRRDELYVRVGGHSRSLVLPVGLQDREVTAATVEDGWLRIAFAAPPSAAVGGRTATATV
jgi:arsenite-transporting ATPase